MPAHYLQIREPDSDIELEFKLLAKRYESSLGLTQGRLFNMLWQHGSEAVSRQLKEEKEERKERKERENVASKRASLRRNGVEGGS